MMTVVALLILGAAQLGLMWLARAATRIIAPVKDGPRRALRAFFHWYGAALVNTALLGVIPAMLSGMMAQWLAPVQRPLIAAGAGFAVLAWTYPIWVQIMARRNAG